MRHRVPELNTFVTLHPRSSLAAIHHQFSVAFQMKIPETPSTVKQLDVMKGLEEYTEGRATWLPDSSPLDTLPEETPVGSAAARGRASTGTFSGSPSATDAARQRVRGSKSVPRPPAASPDVLHLGNPSCAPAVRGSIEQAPNAAFRTSGLRLHASGAAVSNTVPVFPRLVSSIGPSIP